MSWLSKWFKVGATKAERAAPIDEAVFEDLRQKRAAAEVEPEPARRVARIRSAFCSRCRLEVGAYRTYADGTVVCLHCDGRA